jgi:hypothetical protein
MSQLDLQSPGADSISEPNFIFLPVPGSTKYKKTNLDIGLLQIKNQGTDPSKFGDNVDQDSHRKVVWFWTAIQVIRHISNRAAPAILLGS